MSIESWIFVDKYVASSEDNNEHTVKREVLWQTNSYDIGIEFSEYFGLESGEYQSTTLECLREFADECSQCLGDDATTYARTSLMEFEKCLQIIDDSDDLIVSVDW